MSYRQSLGVIATISILVFTGCGKEEVPAKAPVRPVVAIKVADASQLTGRSFPGRAKATQEVNLSFRVSGPLTSLPVNVGDRVKRGQLLGRIDPRDFDVTLRNAEGQLARAKANLAAMREARPEEIRQAKAAVSKAEAAMTLADQEYDRVMRIRSQDAGAVSQSMVDRATAEKERADSALRAAREELQIAETGARPEDVAAQQAEIRSLEADVQAAKDKLSYTYLKAPFGGVIVETFVENFEDVRAKQPIVRLLDPSRIEMVVDIPENLISYAPQIEEVFVRFDPFPDVEVAAKIKEIGTEASQTTRTYPVTLIMDPPEGVQILPGMAGKTYTKERVGPEAAEGGIEVPLSALLQSGEENQSHVWVIDEASNTVTRRPVTTGRFTDFGVLVPEGLEPGEWVVTAGVHQLRDGQQVRLPQ